MQIKKVAAGDEVSMPMIAIGDDHGGVSIMKSLIDGVLIQMTPQESQTGLLFIPEEKLKEVGYFTLDLDEDEEFIEIEDEEGQ